MTISLASDGGFAVRHVAQEEIRLGETRYGLPSSDDDLRDEVDKAAMQGLLYEMSYNQTPVGVIVSSAFELADAFLAERARRREGR